MRKQTLTIALVTLLSVYVYGGQVTGKVTDSQTDEPLMWCNILVKGTFDGTTTQDGGQYALEANPGDVLLVSYIGYVTQEIPVEEGAMSINISLNTDMLRPELSKSKWLKVLNLGP